jgi:hypothetical protein
VREARVDKLLRLLGNSAEGDVFDLRQAKVDVGVGSLLRIGQSAAPVRPARLELAEQAASPLGEGVEELVLGVLDDLCGNGLRSAMT